MKTLDKAIKICDYDSIKIKPRMASKIISLAKTHGYQKGDVWIEGNTLYIDDSKKSYSSFIKDLRYSGYMED